MDKFEPLFKNFPHMLHGGDYNPDQWREYPEVLEEDIRLMNLAGVNSASLGIFSWSMLEPEEGEFDFSFMDETMDRLHKGGIKVVLATPSGARPFWMSKKYPEIMRMNEDRQRILGGKRHNHCHTSPIYREKVQKINRLIAERYKDHPALIAWHISNEYGGGYCYCDKCIKAFQEWLKVKYNNDLDALNHAYWADFWSHRYYSWDEIEPAGISIGGSAIEVLDVDWKRFQTHQTIDFYKNEIVPLRELTPHIPITTNFMGTYELLDYFKFGEAVDVVSNDCYPMWHKNGNNVEIAQNTAFIHNLERSTKDGKPFMLMESTPSQVNWQTVNKLKKPGMHKLSSLQAVACGADTVQYFQWRKGRGGTEKHHGAVVDHLGTENNRVFKEVAELGDILKQLDCVVGTKTKAEAAVIFDWENMWAVDLMQGIVRNRKLYVGTCNSHYRPLWNNAVNTDIISSDKDFSKYKIIIAPMLYMLKPGVEEKIEQFVKNGGTFVATYTFGEVDETMLCHLGGFPAGKLKDVFGIWNEEVDALWEDERNGVSYNGKDYEAIDICEIIHAKGAEVLAEYTSDFYKGMPAVTRNKYGKGSAYYIAFRDTGKLVEDLYKVIIDEVKPEIAIDAKMPCGVTASSRTDGEFNYVFLQNYNGSSFVVTLEKEYEDLLSGEKYSGEITLEAYGIKILKIAI